MSFDSALVVLAGIIPGRRDHLLYALQHLSTDHFREESRRNLFTLLERYYDVANDILPRTVLTSMLQRNGTDASRSLLYEALHDEASSTSVTDGEFRYAVDALKDQRAEQLTGEAITVGMEILQNGAEVNRVEVRGHAAARDYLYSELTRVDKLGATESAPEGDIRQDAREMLQEYSDRKTGKVVPGVGTGISVIDRAGGLGNGELVLLCAYTGEGKSQMSTQTAWDVAVRQGKNVFFATSETVRSQVRRRLVARHSRLPMFNLPGGLDTTEIKNGTLSAEHEEVFQAALDDLSRNPAYGKIHIAQVPRGATLSYVEARLSRAASSWQVDLCVMDYLALLRADTKRQKSQEEYNDILKDAKTIATAHDGGRGVPFLSPWAMSQAAWKGALGRDGTPGTGEYGLGSLAETSEAEKSADGIWTLLRFPENLKEVKVQALKTRDGELPPAATLEVDYRNAYLADKVSSSRSAYFDGDDDL